MHLHVLTRDYLACHHLSGSTPLLSILSPATAWIPRVPQALCGDSPVHRYRGAPGPPAAGSRGPRHGTD